MEHKDWSQITPTDAPYINSLLQLGSHAKNYHNVPLFLGSLHPAEPNYLWLEAGTHIFQDRTFTTNDVSTILNVTGSKSHLANLLEADGLTWRSYQEDMQPGICPILTTDQGYAPKHNPFVFFKDVVGDVPDAKDFYCATHHSMLTPEKLQNDLNSGNVANYNFLSPNSCNSMRSCPISEGDKWLETIVPIIMNSNTYKKDGVIFITWDQGFANNPIGFITLSPFAKPGHSSNEEYSHASLLKTIQNIFNLTPYIGYAASTKTLGLSDLFSGLSGIPVDIPVTDIVTTNGNNNGSTTSPGTTTYVNTYTYTSIIPTPVPTISDEDENEDDPELPATGNPTPTPTPTGTPRPTINATPTPGVGGPSPTPYPTPTPTIVPTQNVATIDVRIIRPFEGQQVTDDMTVVVYAESRTGFGVSRVDYFIDGSYEASSRGDPHSMTFNLTGLHNGNHNLYVKAWDTNGHVGVSNLVQFSVNNTVINPTPTPFVTYTPTPTPTPTSTPSPTPTFTPTPTMTLTPTPTSTLTPTPTPTPDGSPTPSITPTATPTVTPTPTTIPSPTNTPTPTGTPIPTPTPTPVATEIMLNPFADTFASREHKTRNYGTDILKPRLISDGSPTRIIFLKFDLSPLATKNIKSAKLRLKIYNNFWSGSKSEQRVKKVSDTSWIENRLTYNNMPPLGSEIARIKAAKRSTEVTVDITNYVKEKQGWMMSLGIDGVKTDSMYFYSRESVSNSPKLIITLE